LTRCRGGDLFELLFPLAHEGQQHILGFAIDHRRLRLATRELLTRFQIAGDVLPKPEILRSGLPVLSIAGSLGILVIPLSMASTSEKSLTIQGNGDPSGYPLPWM